MPCIPFREHGHTSFLCVGNDPVSVTYRGRTYRFEWTSASGWIPVNKDSSERLTPVPAGAWEALVAECPGPWGHK
jgi:hypothetical protein